MGTAPNRATGITKAGGVMLIADAADRQQAMIRMQPTGFERFCRSYMTEGEADRAMLLKNGGMMVIMIGTAIPGTNRPTGNPPPGRNLRLPSHDPAMGANTLGETSWTGDVAIRPGLSWAEQRQVLLHESVHKWLTAPGNGPGLTCRQWLTQQGYNNSAILRATEEAIAQGYARFQVTGSLSTGITEGLAFPFTYGYVTPLRFATEAGAVGGAVYYFTREGDE